MANNQFYIAQAYRRVFTAGSKPLKDFEQTLQKLKFKNIGLPSITLNSPYLWWIYNWLSAHLACLRMPKNGTIVLQYPEQRHIESLFKKASKRNNKVIVLIHDLDELRGFTPKAQQVLKNADVLISHTSKMSEYLNTTYPQAQTIELGLFDYILPQTSIPNSTPTPSHTSIVFAGNLSKALFLTKLPESNIISFNIFGPHLPKLFTNSSSICYHGVCAPDELPSKMQKYAFGLVWDGDSADECSGEFGTYLQYNIPFKSVSYLSAGIPIIVWSKMGIAKFVKEHKIGVCVNSLSEIEPILAKMTNEQYLQMRNNVDKIRHLITTGHFAQDAIKKALTLI